MYDPENLNRARWGELVGFRQEEFTPTKGYYVESVSWDMDQRFMVDLALLRQRADIWIYIHANGGFAFSGHSEGSMHYGLEDDFLGKASDIHMIVPSDGSRVPMLRQALLAYSHTNFSIGIYPYWNSPGLHLDCRSLFGKRNIVWWRDEKKNYHYYPYHEFDKLIKDMIDNVPRELLWK